MKAELRSTIVSILLGGFTGYFLGFEVWQPIMTYLAIGEFFPVSGIQIILFILANMVASLAATISLFFVGFSAVSIAYLRSHREKPQIPTPSLASTQ